MKKTTDMHRRAINTMIAKILALMVCLMLPVYDSMPVYAKAPTVYTVKLPKDSCSVKARWRGQGNKTVIHIQDAHTSVDAQMNIARTINQLVRDNDLDYIGVEGAATEINVKELQHFPSKTTRERVTDWYVEKGILSGVEKAAIASDESFTLLGLEDRDLFRKNFRAYYGTQLKQGDILDQLDEIENILNDLKTPVFNDSLRSFSDLASAWQKGSVDLFEFVQALEKQIEALHIPVDDYVNYAAMRETAVLKMRIPEGTLKTEMNDLQLSVSRAVASLGTNKQSRAAIKKISTVTDAFKNGSVSEREYLETVKLYCPKVGIDFMTFKYTNNELKYLQSFSRIDFDGVARDIRAINAAVLRKSAVTDDEKDLVERIIMMSLLNTITGLTAIEDEVAVFAASEDKCTYDYFASFFARMSAKYGTPTPQKLCKDDFEKIILYARHFYLGAQLRNDALVGNLMKAMTQRGDSIGVLVSGGYHTSGITKLLESQNVSYVVVNPIIESIDRLCAYDDKMKGGLVALSPTLVGYITLLLLDKQNCSIDEGGIIGGTMSIVSVADEVAQVMTPYVQDDKAECSAIINREVLGAFVNADAATVLAPVVSGQQMSSDVGFTDAKIKEPAIESAAKLLFGMIGKKQSAYVSDVAKRVFGYIAQTYRQFFEENAIHAAALQFEFDCAASTGSSEKFHDLFDALAGRTVHIFVDETHMPSLNEKGYYGALLRQFGKASDSITIKSVSQKEDVQVTPDGYTIIFAAQDTTSIYASLGNTAKTAVIAMSDTPEMRTAFNSILLLLAGYVVKGADISDVQITAILEQVKKKISLDPDLIEKFKELEKSHQARIASEQSA